MVRDAYCKKGTHDNYVDPNIIKRPKSKTLLNYVSYLTNESCHEVMRNDDWAKTKEIDSSLITNLVLCMRYQLWKQPTYFDVWWSDIGQIKKICI